MATIRDATLDDLRTIAGYNQCMALETEGLQLQDAVITGGVRRVLEGTAAAAYYVAQAQGEVVGQLMITKEWSDWRCKDIWWIQSVYVRPSHRKQGIFKALYAHARQQAQQAGAAGLRLYADVDNVSAHATYERLGMTSHYKVFEDMLTQH